MEIIDVTCSFDGLTALSDISFSVKPGEVIGIIGPNGAGKTTLFNLITGIVKPTSGRIIVLGNDVTGMPPHRIAELGVVRTFQNIRLFENQSVLENVLVGCHLKLRGDVASAVPVPRSIKGVMQSALNEPGKPWSSSAKILRLVNRSLPGSFLS